MIFYEEDVIICSKCGSPIPSFLNADKVAKKDNDEIFVEVQKKNILKTFQKDDEETAIDAITTFCRKVKKFNVNNLEELIDKMKLLYDYYLRKSNPPNFELASFVEYCERMVVSVKNNDGKLEDVLIELSKVKNKKKIIKYKFHF